MNPSYWFILSCFLHLNLSSNKFVKQWGNRRLWNEISWTGIDDVDLLTQQTSKLNLNEKSAHKNNVLIPKQSNFLHKNFREIPARLSIAAYNTNWLFLHDQAALTKGLKWPQACPWSRKDSIRHLQDVADVLNHVSADIYVLSEVQSKFVLEELKKLLVGGESYHSFLVPGTDHYLGMNVGILSKITPSIEPYRIDVVGLPRDRPDKVNIDTAKKTKLSRNLIMEMKLFDHEDDSLQKCRQITLIGAHLKSGTQNDWSSRIRHMQCSYLAELIDDYSQQGHSIILAGDLNDFDPEVPGLADGRPLYQSIDLVKKSGGGLSNVLQNVPREKRFTTTNQRVLDYILLDQTFPSFSVEVFNQPKFSKVSDHYPIRVELDLMN